ncbi:MAG: ferritin-like domain-containing protein [Alphaproteobacteria bacterium]|nr:ferritin-like domain-containing protein [Alphaproteobacteria bacterium]
MHRGGIATDLNLVLRDNLTLIDKGFVQALCLRFHDSRERAQLAYADNLAETRRLMILLREMQRLGIPLDPDGAANVPERGDLDLQHEARAIWLSDGDLAGRKLECLLRAQNALQDSGKPTLATLARLIAENRELHEDLGKRAQGIENFDPPDPEEQKSEAEKATFEEFLKHLPYADPQFLAGESEVAGENLGDVSATLNAVLNNSFIAIDQFFVHGFVFRGHREHAIAQESIGYSILQMGAAYRLAQRILVLGAVPGGQNNEELRLSYRVVAGQDPAEALQNDLDLLDRRTAGLERARMLMNEEWDRGSFDLLSILLAGEARTREKLRARQGALAGGTTIGGAGEKFDAMLSMWGAG